MVTPRNESSCIDVLGDAIRSLPFEMIAYELENFLLTGIIFALWRWPMRCGFTWTGQS